jgi:hypothetical protein
MKKLLYLMVMMFIVPGLAGMAYSGGGPNPNGGCHHLYYDVLGGTAPGTSGGLPKNQGTTVLGQFILTQEFVDDGAGGKIPGRNVLVQLQIAKGNDWYSYEFTVDSASPPDFIPSSICDFDDWTDEHLLDQYFLWPCEFDLQREIMGEPPSGYDGYAGFAVSLSTKGWDCNDPGAEFLPPPGLPGYVDGAYSGATRWGDIKLKFVPYKLQ